MVGLPTDKGPNIEARDDYGETALIAAAMHGEGGTVRLLIEKRANIEAKRTNGRVALMAASGSGVGAEAVVRLLIEKGANIHEGTDGEGTALLDAAWLSNGEVVRFADGEGSRH